MCNLLVVYVQIKAFVGGSPRDEFINSFNNIVTPVRPSNNLVMLVVVLSLEIKDMSILTSIYPSLMQLGHRIWFDRYLIL